MNYKDALKILELDDKNLDINIIKKKYKMLALQYHPDKNPCKNAKIKFIEIKEAYELLINELEDIQENKTEENDSIFFNYKDIMIQFLKSIIDDNENTSIIFYNIFHKITQTCEEKSLDFLKNINKDLLIKIYDVLYKYNNIFQISDNYVLKVKEIIEDRIKNDECIILNPTIEDLLEKNIYKLNIKGEILYIPLWHHELIYEINNNDIYIKCIPILPDNYDIDNNNNLIIRLNYNIKDLFNMEEISVKILENIYYIKIDEIRIKQNQKLLLSKVGVPHINSNNIYDISKLADIILDLYIII